jgi:hypothetical protein
MAAALVGSMVCKPALFNDWVLPDFLKWANTKSTEDCCIGPDFVVRGQTFFILMMPNSPRGTVRVRLGKRSKDPIFLNHFSISLIGEDGSRKEIVSKNNCSFDKEYTEDAIFQKNSNFDYNGKICIRATINIRSQNKLMIAPIQDNSLVDDLSFQLAEQTLSFTDAVLVCHERKFPVHRFMLATRSPVFKAMFTHDEGSEGQNQQANNQVENQRITSSTVVG